MGVGEVPGVPVGVRRWGPVAALGAGAGCHVGPPRGDDGRGCDAELVGGAERSQEYIAKFCQYVGGFGAPVGAFDECADDFSAFFTDLRYPHPVASLDAEAVAAVVRRDGHGATHTISADRPGRCVRGRGWSMLVQ